MKIGTVEVWPTAKATFKDFQQDDLQGLAAEVAYHFLFSVIPLLIFLTALSGFVSRSVGVNDAMSSITDWLFEDSGLPRDAAQALRTPIEKVITQESGGFLSFGALLALWSGKNAISALMKALNVAFDVQESRPWWKKTAIAVGLTVALGLAIIVASSIFLAGSFVGEGLAEVLGLGSTWTAIWSVLQWVLIPVLLVVALAFFYWAGPDVEAPFKWLTPGAVLAVILWAVATLGLSIYFQYFGPSMEAYGFLGAVLAFVFWLYVMSLILLLGGELNSVLARAEPEVQAQVAGSSKKAGDSTARRRQAAGKPNAKTVDEPAAKPSPARPRPVLGSAVPWPSAEREARIALAAEGSAGQRRRFRGAVTALAVSVVAAISAALAGAGRRLR